jgi:hypothetical protein
MHTLNSFLKGELVLSGLEELNSLNGFTFDDLSAIRQRKFKNGSLRIIVISGKQMKNSDLIYLKELIQDTQY